MGDQRPSHSIPVEKFHYGGDKDFDDWIQSFEDACIVPNHSESPEAKHRLYLEWFPLKLDTQALALDRQKTEVDYPDVKAERRPTKQIHMRKKLRTTEKGQGTNRKSVGGQNNKERPRCTGTGVNPPSNHGRWLCQSTPPGICWYSQPPPKPSENKQAD
jgi:hypothetical protein